MILTPDEMRAAEAAAVRAGVALATLMENAGAATARAGADLVEEGPVAVLCGPGSNGGDGFVAARRLKEAGRPVRVGLIGPKEALKGDAAAMARLFDGVIEPLSPAMLEDAALIIDALFGTGLTRPLDGAAAETVSAANALRAAGAVRILAVDIPSGVDPATGATAGPAIEADRTVAFAAKKPGHLLYPGRANCGETIVVDIAIPAAALEAAASKLVENGPDLWMGSYPQLKVDAHKYERGNVAVISGPRLRTGAARLAARGALRAGAGLVTVFSRPDAADENARSLTAVMVRETKDAEAVATALEDRRFTAVVHGPGAGVGEETRQIAHAILASRAGAVLDADALTSFEADPDVLSQALRRDDVLTPHPGEFERVFPGMMAAAGDRLNAARRAAEKAGAVIVLKGADTVVARPDGRAAINSNAPAWLATAGAGDVLAGFIAALRGRGMPGFEAAAAGVWLHGACARRVGPGLIAEDLPETLPAVLSELFAGGGAG